MSNSCIGDSTNPPKNLDRTKGASHRSTSKVKKHPLAKAPFRQAGGSLFVCNGRLAADWATMTSKQRARSRKDKWTHFHRATCTSPKKKNTSSGGHG